MSKDPKSSYYDAGGIETLDVIRAKLTPEMYQGFLLGNVYKYASRLPHKGTPERDAEKLANYARWLSDAMGGEVSKDPERKDREVECALCTEMTPYSETLQWRHMSPERLCGPCFEQHQRTGI